MTNDHALRDRSVLVTGATGYVASRLIPELLAGGARVRATSRAPEALVRRFPEVEVVSSDLLVEDSLDAALEGIEVAYYLVHSMEKGDFEDRDRVAARNFLAAAERSGVERIVYLGGLGEAGDDLSTHLSSRHEIGRVLASGNVPVTELRAAIVIGSGSTAFDMLRYLTERLPMMVAPRWLETRIQPIAEDDLVAYLLAAGGETEPGGVVQVGGAEVVTYRRMIHGYASVRGLRRIVVAVPLLTPRLSSYWLRLITPVPTAVGRALIDGLQNEVVVTDDEATRRFPEIQPMDYTSSVVTAVATQCDTLGQELASGQSIPGARVAVVGDERRVLLGEERRGLRRTLEDLGGDPSWYPLPWAWSIRRWFDRLAGGGDLSWRRSEQALAPGAVVDWWSVELIERDSIVLRALMRAPGEAWLAFREDADAPALVQSAAFLPRGIRGRLYWWVLWPFHHPIFLMMSRRFARRMTLTTNEPKG